MNDNGCYPFRPFADDRKRLAGSFFDVHELDTDGRFVVKELMEPSLLNMRGGAIERVKRDVALLTEYLAPYLPRMQMVIGRGASDEPTIFVIQEKIEGEAVTWERSSVPDELRMLDDFVCRMIAMYRGTFTPERDAGLVPEVQLGGFALFWGVSAADPSKTCRFWLVDLYPLMPLEPMPFQSWMRQWIAFLEDQQERIEGGWELVPLRVREVCDEARVHIYQRQR